MSLFTPEQIAEWRTEQGNGMISAIGEYTPTEFWLALDEIERLQQALRLAHTHAEAQLSYPPCDTCGKLLDYEAWHSNDGVNRHLHACNECHEAAHKAPEAANTIVVSAEPLRRVLQALVGAPHLIRELQVTRHPAELFKENPINVLTREYNAAGIREQAEVKS